MMPYSTAVSRACLAAALVSCAAMSIYPPWTLEIVGPESRVINRRSSYSWIWRPPLVMLEREPEPEPLAELPKFSSDLMARAAKSYNAKFPPPPPPSRRSQYDFVPAPLNDNPSKRIWGLYLEAANIQRTDDGKEPFATWEEFIKTLPRPPRPERKPEPDQRWIARVDVARLLVQCFGVFTASLALVLFPRRTVRRD